MKAITLTQPWATLIALGHKRIETRSWKADTLLGQEIAIHAAKGLNGIPGGETGLEELCNTEPFKQLLEPHYGRQLHLLEDEADVDSSLLPRGAIVAIVRVERFIELFPIAYDDKPMPPEATPHDRALGLYDAGRKGWILSEPTRLLEPAPATGAQGIWDWTPESAAVAA